MSKTKTYFHSYFFLLFQVKIWFQNRRSKYKKMMKAGPGSVPPPNMLTSGGQMPGSPGSPMMPPLSHTPNSSQGQMSPQGPPQGHVSLGHHSPGLGGGNPHHQQHHQHHPHQQHQQQQQQHHHQHNNGLYGLPGGHHTPTPSPAGDMSPQTGHHMPPSGSPPVSISQWHSIHQQDIKPPHMNPGAPHGMFPQYSWYQTTDNNMNQGLLT